MIPFRKEIRGALALLAVVTIFGCGRKADPKPYVLVQPEATATLSGDIVKEGVRLRWMRPENTVGGDRMDDLGGFVVFRGRPGQESEELAKVPVEDRARFQREKRFEYVDRGVGKGEAYYYRIVSHTTDGYYSEPSNQVSLEIPR